MVEVCESPQDTLTDLVTPEIDSDKAKVYASVHCARVGQRKSDAARHVR
jgi:hypothetical protein